MTFSTGSANFPAGRRGRVWFGRFLTDAPRGKRGDSRRTLRRGNTEQLEHRSVQLTDRPAGRPQHRVVHKSQTRHLHPASDDRCRRTRTAEQRNGMSRPPPRARSPARPHRRAPRPSRGSTRPGSSRDLRSATSSPGIAANSRGDNGIPSSAQSWTVSPRRICSRGSRSRSSALLRVRSSAISRSPGYRTVFRTSRISFFPIVCRGSSPVTHVRT